MAKAASVQTDKTWSDPISIPEFIALRHEEVLYLTTVGHKSGKPRTIEIWFVRNEGRLCLLAEHGVKARRVRNIQANSEVRFQTVQYCFGACGRSLDDARDRQEWQIITALARRKYGWGRRFAASIRCVSGTGPGEYLVEKVDADS